ncbi:MAG: tRNA1(Val) (adenine(37)-N6)-methyltransferase [Luteibaculaceae bacterium]
MSKPIPFQFEGLQLNQRDDVFKIGTDALLLGPYLKDKLTVTRALEVGCGTGILSLLLALYYPKIAITALDVHAAAAKLTQENFKLNFPTRELNAVQSDFLHYQDSVQYDLIFSNPPYFLEAFGSAVTHKHLARHADALDYETLLAKSATLLSPDGNLALIFPAAYEQHVRFLLLKNRFYLRYFCQVRDKTGAHTLRNMLIAQYKTVPEQPFVKEVKFTGR